MNACGAVVTALRSCGQGLYRYSGPPGFTGVNCRYYFIPPGMERWTVLHTRLDPWYYWPERPAPGVLHFDCLPATTYDPGDPPAVYPPPCMRFPARLFDKLPRNTLKTSTVAQCLNNCSCVSCGPFPFPWNIYWPPDASQPAGRRCSILPGWYSLPSTGDTCFRNLSLPPLSNWLLLWSCDSGVATFGLFIQDQTHSPVRLYTYRGTTPTAIAPLGCTLTLDVFSSYPCPSAPDTLFVSPITE